ncbi:MAG: hypothetical protein P4L38_08185 [Syntrophaceae bacterium]|nr:hypothetical protein [Syntrophaceae bacterium]
MNIGEALQKANLALMKYHGQTIMVHRNYGTPDAIVTETQGIKTAKEHNPEEVQFLFPKRIDLLDGDVLQVKESHDLWEVVDTEDQVQGNRLIYIQARVEKLTKDGKRKQIAPTESVVFHGPVMGAAVQIGGSQNAQTVTVTNASKVNEDIAQLVHLIESSSLSRLHKDDAVEALNRIKQLDGNEKNDEVLKRVGDRLASVREVIVDCEGLWAVAAPILTGIARYFGLSL